MHTLTGTHIKLRALEPEDLEFLFQIENNESFWEVSHTQAPFSKFLLKQYLENAHLDIFEAKQLRLVIDKKSTGKSVGMIDLFDFNPQHKRAGIGILIHPDFQQKGFASEALQLLINYCFTHLHLHQLYANITNNNTNSLHLFEKQNFKQIGIKKDWIFYNGTYKDELLFQLINE
ncbi:MAG: GNAT family N-acetyltransferase [Tenacibaculum sp.]|uniref:GNAT family N-acetyltransferase n=1 Tax=Tenacibaculum sp. TaxID=1906242 RepID=UPI001856E283|nr:GNAT family protein [Tenacibaculum sp.]NVK09044.1 GNAT family N-acetyltransferase [Tenacibaculum sp.]